MKNSTITNETFPSVLNNQGDHFLRKLFQVIFCLETFNGIMLIVCLHQVLLLTKSIIKYIKINESFNSEFMLRSTNKSILRFLQILIVGGPNSGKTATQRILAGQKMTNVVSSCPNLKYTCNNMFGCKVFAAKWENVPQFGSDSMDDIQLFADNLKNMRKYLDDFQVMILCLPFYKILNNDFKEYIQTLNKVLGKSVFENRIIFAFTHGEIFEAIKYKDVANFEDWITRSGSCVLKDALKEFKNRYVLLCNNTNNEEKNRSQALKIVTMCTKIVLKNANFRIPEEAEECFQGKDRETFVQPIPNKLSEPSMSEESPAKNLMSIPPVNNSEDGVIHGTVDLITATRTRILLNQPKLI